jgi:IS605 OrfB family transposase
MNNVKKDLIRKIASEVRHLAVSEGCDVVLVEDLEYFTQSIIREKGDNSLLSIWSPNTVLRWIRNALEPHGIPMIRIDPRNTSKIDPRTGEFGFNHFRASKSVLLVERDGNLEIINADIASAQNLQRRFWSRCSDVFRLDYIPYTDLIEPLTGGLLTLTESATSIRISRYLDAKVGSKYAEIIDGVLQPMRPAAYKGRLSSLDGQKPDRLYRHGDHWMSWNDHVKAMDDLFERFATEQSQVSESEEAQQFIRRVKSFREKGLWTKTRT